MMRRLRMGMGRSRWKFGLVMTFAWGGGISEQESTSAFSLHGRRAREHLRHHSRLHSAVWPAYIRVTYDALPNGERD